MLLKSADDKSKRVALLEELQCSTLLDFHQKRWLREELMRFTKGLQGERESAHYLDHYFKDGENNVVLHDLRFVIDGEVTQIDHLIINRTGHIFLLETKNYACNLIINDHGEFTAVYGNAQFGIPSPMEQSRRHERVLAKLLERLDILGRTQKLPDFHHVVMLHPSLSEILCARHNILPKEFSCLAMSRPPQRAAKRPCRNSARKCSKSSSLVR